eukprot:2930677-Prymnesium_polylepis.1
MEEVRLCPISMMKPLITKMDSSLSGLKKCKQLRMSSNSIQKIEGLAGMDNLQARPAAGGSVESEADGRGETAHGVVWGARRPPMRRSAGSGRGRS